MIPGGHGPSPVSGLAMRKLQEGSLLCGAELGCDPGSLMSAGPGALHVSQRPRVAPVTAPPLQSRKVMSPAQGQAHSGAFWVSF